jgi:hypothetical protein
MSSKRLKVFLATAAVLVGGIALAAIATGTKGGATRPGLSYSGRLGGASGNVNLTFHFTHGPSGTEICAPTVSAVPLESDGSFAIEVPIDSCQFDGSDVSYRVDAVTTQGSISTPVTTIEPVPYAKYSDVAATLATQQDGAAHLGNLTVDTLTANQIKGFKTTVCTHPIGAGVSDATEAVFSQDECGGTLPRGTCVGFLQSMNTPGAAADVTACCPSAACATTTDPGYHYNTTSPSTADGSISCAFLCN